jgi:tetratricopeptide (TPR) repeat protein
MFAFSFRAKTQNDKVIIDRINAESVEEAWSILEGQGYTAIELLDNEITAIKLDDENSPLRLQFSAEKALAMQAQKSIVLKLVRKFFSFPYISILLVLLSGFIYLYSNNFLDEYGLLFRTSEGDMRWELVYKFILLSKDFYVYLVILLAGYLLWFAKMVMPMVMYNQALEANAWCRWREVEYWMRRLQKWKDRFKISFPEHELLFRLATAEAGQGRLNEALQRVAHLETDSSLIPGFYYCRLASLFLVTRDFRQALDCQRKAFEINPSSTNTISLAHTLAQRFGDYSAAQALLDEVNDKKLPLMEKLFACYVRGIIALETGHPNQSCQYLEEVFSLGDNFGLPLMQGMLLEVSAYYALALVAMGKAEIAEKHFKRAYPMLIVQDETELLARCERARKNG